MSYQDTMDAGHTVDVFLSGHTVDVFLSGHTVDVFLSGHNGHPLIKTPQESGCPPIRTSYQATLVAQFQR
jgi:hypothetical protein